MHMTLNHIYLHKSKLDKDCITASGGAGIILSMDMEVRNLLSYYIVMMTFSSTFGSRVGDIFIYAMK